MPSVLKVALFLSFFLAHAVIAEDQPLPLPVTGKWPGANFCISEDFVVKLLEESRGLEISGRGKEGCGILFIPMTLTATPIRRVSFNFGDRVIVKVTNKFGEEAFSYLEPQKHIVLYPLGKEAQSEN